MKSNLFTALLFLLASCNSQNATITIYNKANTNTDSIYFSHLKMSYPFVVKPGDNKSITIDISKEEYIGEGGLNAYLYSNNRIFPIMFCRKGLTFLNKDKNVIYLFPNAATADERLPVKPTEFDFYLNNYSGSNIDSITSGAQYKPNYKLSDSLTNIYLLFDEFSKKPEIYVHQNGKKYTIVVDHPWDIWNYRSSMYNFHEGGTSEKDSNFVIGKR